jgi:CheY-like chemotaxis protein
VFAQWFNVAFGSVNHAIIKGGDMADAEPINILLVEDNEDDIEITQMAFEQAKIRNHILVARNGQEALDYLYGRGIYRDREKHPMPGMILMDIKMPKKDGFEALDELKRDARLKIIPVTMLTSSKNEEDIARSYDKGAVAYICKTVCHEDFMRRVECFNFFWQISELPKVKEE